VWVLTAATVFDTEVVPEPPTVLDTLVVPPLRRRPLFAAIDGDGGKSLRLGLLEQGDRLGVFGLVFASRLIGDDRPDARARRAPDR